jgi:Ca2+-binding EF-hand superfamily protein
MVPVVDWSQLTAAPKFDGRLDTGTSAPDETELPRVRKLVGDLMSYISDRNGLAALRVQFDKMDTDGSGMLDAEEFWNGLIDFGMLVTPDDAAALMSAFDPSGDGKVSCEEFTAVASRELERHVRKLMEELISKTSDRDGLAALRVQFDLLDTDGR